MSREPGMYQSISDVDYHADRDSLSSSGARKLLPPSCPAIFRWEQDHPRESTDAFDLGHAAHALVLGEGVPIVEVQADSWRTKAAQEEKAAAYAAGETPLLTEQYNAVHAMAKSVRDHPLAARLFDNGVAERSGYWVDETGVTLRLRPDWLTTIGGQLCIVDYKTSLSANPDEFAESAADYGYAMQQPFYEDGVKALGLSDDPAFLFVVQSKKPPYLVSVVELDPDDVALGRRLNRKAIDIFARCVAENHWPAYGNDIHTIGLPSWSTKRLEGLLA